VVRLLRGEDIKEANSEVCFLPFLNGLCEKNSELRVYILAWDFSLIYALEREWWQKYIFNWTTKDQLQFRFDSCHPLGASHHQKFVVVDGHIAFVGGADICASRWDDRDHHAAHPERYNNESKPYGPYHEIQSYHIGPVAQRLAELFAARWERAGGGALKLAPAPPLGRAAVEPTIAIAATQVALSRTQPTMLVPPQSAVQEICRLYIDAIAAAERLIYIENQYFSSEAIYNALVARMHARQRPRLQIVMILPKRPEAFLEEVAMGFAQAKMLRSLTEIAHATGHAFGVYYPATSTTDVREVSTYIHAKLLLVDDRFLTVGSANTTNRSMGFDTELNISWEASSYRQRSFVRSFRDTRMSLLAEHSGVALQSNRSQLGRVRGLVDYLNRLADSAPSRLRHHPMDTSFDESEWLQALKPENFVLDPGRPLFVEESDKQNVSESFRIGKSISWMNNSLFNTGTVWVESRRPATSDVPPAAFVTQEKSDPFTNEPAHLRTTENAYPVQLSGQLQRSLVLAIALAAVVLWWFLQVTGPQP
jgi:phosphatidylserine/phosphatidylglycerophosphate/cardiolipin synthase-like enzyme